MVVNRSAQNEPPRPPSRPRLSQLNVSASARLQQVIRQDRVRRRAPTGARVLTGVCWCRGEGPARGREAERKAMRCVPLAQLLCSQGKLEG